MDWNLNEALSYYKQQGAPREQSALVNLLKEIQREHGGTIPGYMVGLIAQTYDIKETFLLAIIKRIPSLRMDHQHLLEMCAGPNCGKQVALASYAEKLHTGSGNAFALKFSPCMRMCGKGPNIRWDGIVYHRADEALLRKLLQDAGIEFSQRP